MTISYIINGITWKNKKIDYVLHKTLLSVEVAYGNTLLQLCNGRDPHTIDITFPELQVVILEVTSYDSVSLLHPLQHHDAMQTANY